MRIQIRSVEFSNVSDAISIITRKIFTILNNAALIGARLNSAILNITETQANKKYSQNRISNKVLLTQFRFHSRISMFLKIL